MLTRIRPKVTEIIEKVPTVQKKKRKPNEDLIVSPKRTKRIPASNSLQCEHCSVFFTRKDNLARHLRNKHWTLFQSLWMGFEFLTILAMVGLHFNFTVTLIHPMFPLFWCVVLLCRSYTWVVVMDWSGWSCGAPVYRVYNTYYLSGGIY